MFHGDMKTPLQNYENAIFLYLAYYGFDEPKNLEAVILILAHIDNFISTLEVVIERKAESVENALTQVSNSVIHIECPIY